MKKPMQLWEAYLLLDCPATAYTKEELYEAKRLVSRPVKMASGRNNEIKAERGRNGNLY